MGKSQNEEGGQSKLEEYDNKGRRDVRRSKEEQSSLWRHMREKVKLRVE